MSLAPLASLALIASAFQTIPDDPTLDWTVTLDLPELAFSIDAARLASIRFSDSHPLSPAARQSISAGRWMAIEKPHLMLPADLADVRRTFAGSTINRVGISPIAGESELPCPGSGVLALSAGFQSAFFEDFVSSFSCDMRGCVSRTTLRIRVPELDLLADELLTLDAGSEAWKAALGRAVDAHPALITVLVRRAAPPWQVRAGTSSLNVYESDRRDRAEERRRRAIIDAVVREEYGVGKLEPRVIVERALTELAQRDLTDPNAEQDVLGPLLDLSFDYAPLRALSLVATPDDLIPRIVAGESLCAIAAAWAGQRSAYDACAALWAATWVDDDLGGGMRSHETLRRRKQKLVNAAWAMLKLDPARGGAAILSQLESSGETMHQIEHWVLLGYSGDAEVLRRVRELVAKDERRSDDRTLTIVGIERRATIDDYWLGW